MRKVIMIAAALTLGAATPQLARAQVQVGPTVAFHGDFDLGLGATLMAQTPALGEGLGFLGELLVFFPEPDGLDYLEINGNLTYEFVVEGSAVRPFVLGGLNIARLSADVDGLGDASDTQIGLNIGGGVAFDAGSVRPIVGGRFEVDGGDDFVIFATIPFEVGGG